MTRDTAIKHTQKLFETTTDDSISVRDLFIAFKRDLNKEVENKNWISNYISPLKKYNLVAPVYGERNGRKILDKVKLTLEGRMFVRNIAGNILPNVSPNSEPTLLDLPSHLSSQQEAAGGTSIDAVTDSVTLEEAAKVISRFKATHPEFEVIFEFKLKGSAR